MQPNSFDWSKFTPPAKPFGFIDRPRLLKPLEEASSRARFLMLMAPAGFGKTAILTSLTRAWARADRGRPVVFAWYSLDPSDNDAAVFVKSLVESVRVVDPNVGKNVLAALRGVRDARSELARLLAVFADDLRSVGHESITLVLDDFHFLVDKAILGAIEQVLREESLPFRLLVATETEPPFYLPNLRAREAIVELGEEDLRFTPAEVQELLQSRTGPGFPRAAVESVARETRGWPSAVAVAAAIVTRSGRPLPFTRLAPTEHGYGQLVREVISGWPLKLRSDLLRSAVLPYLERRTIGSLADPASVINAVAEMCLPASRLNWNTQSIRYDQVFRGALMRELAAALGPQDLRALQKEVAAQMADRGMWNEAVSAYLQAWAYEDAATLIEQAADVELARGHVDMVLQWLRAIPSATRKGRPRLMVQEARALLARRELQEARVLLATAEPQLRASQDERGLGLRESTLCALHLAEGRYQDAVRAGEAALSRLSEDEYTELATAYKLLGQALEMQGDLAAAFDSASKGLLSAERSGQQDQVVRALEQLGSLAEYRGEYTTALALTGRAVLRSTLVAAEDLAIVRSGVTAATAYLERGHVEEAASVANRVREASMRLRDSMGAIRAELVMAEVEELSGGIPTNGRADELVAEAEKVGADHLDRSVMLRAAATSMLRRGKLREGEDRARRAAAAAEAAGHEPAASASQLLVVAAQAMRAGPIMPTVRARRLRETLTARDSHRWLAAANALLAQGYATMDIPWRAKENLRRSLELAAREGYIGLPMRTPFHSERLLTLAVRHDVLPEAAGSLLGVDPERGKKVLAPLLIDRRPEVRARAEAALRGLETRAGQLPRPRLTWPGFPNGALGGRLALVSLGGMDAYLDQEPVPWPSSDARNLAAYEIVRRTQEVPREQVLGDLWPGLDASRAQVRLQVALHLLRESLGDDYPDIDLEREAAGLYLWDGAGCFIDVEHFREIARAVNEAMPREQRPLLSEYTVSLLEQAVSVYQGEFLADVDFAWCVDQREELRSQLMHIARLLIDHYMALHLWQEAIRHGLKSLKSDPLQEEVVRDLMVCYFRVGDRKAVLAQYRELKRLMAKMRSAWPSDETRQLRIRLLGK